MTYDCDCDSDCDCDCDCDCDSDCNSDCDCDYDGGDRDNDSDDIGQARDATTKDGDDYERYELNRSLCGKQCEHRHECDVTS